MRRQRMVFRQGERKVLLGLCRCSNINNLKKIKTDDAAKILELTYVHQNNNK